MVRVVLADDHPIILSGLNGLLRERRNLEIVASVTNGHDALTCVRELEPELAVLDINMPELSGLDVLESIEAEGLSTRVIILTASATDAHITTAVSRGAWGIVLKDHAADTLLQCVDKISAGERWLPTELVDPALSREAERAKHSASFDTLTEREQEIASLIAEGLSNKHIARKAQISEGTVKIHLHNIYQKLGIANRTTLATLAQSYSLKKR
jgi:DNA-binding NarL/FixJ family response regulator